MNKVLISIIIPCYNNGTLLFKMIDCILRQTYIDWELIVVDDGSTDSTQDIVRKYTEKDERIKMLIREREPKGAPTCRNIGIKNSNGKYFVIFDADDLISDTCLEKRVAFMEANPDIDYASFPAKMWYANSLIVPQYKDWGKTWGVSNDCVDLLTLFLKGDYPFTVWTNIYKKKSIKNILWDEKLKVYMDFDFIILGIINELKHKFSGLNEIDYFYRIYNNADNICSSFVSEEKNTSTIYLIDKTLDLIKKTKNFNKYKQDFLYFILIHYGRLLSEVDNSNINNSNIDNYLNICFTYYSKFTIKQFQILRFIMLKIKNRIMRQKVIHIIFFIWFEHNRYFNIIKINIQSKLYHNNK